MNGASPATDPGGPDVDVMQTAEVEARWVRLRAARASFHENVAALHRGRAWETLGYASWDELCRAELGGLVNVTEGEATE